MTKPKRKPDDPEETKRFFELAHELDAGSADPGKIDRVFRKVVEKPKAIPPKP